MIDKLIEGNIHNNVECLEVVERLLMTLYQAWRDVVENPRPDGVPSPRLQPEEYKEYMASNPEAVAQMQKGPSPTQDQSNEDGPRLKITA